MKGQKIKAKYLSDYRPPAYLVEDEVKLEFDLDPQATRVRSAIRFYPNPEAPGPFRLDGEKLKLMSARIDGVEVHPDVDAAGLSCTVPDAPFLWEAEVELDPSANTELEGLYLSNGMFCTQCEAEGFRKITFYPDRPDVMAPFRVRINADLPVLLSNGNETAQGPGWAEWHDPWPKPSYLFALVAGDLRAVSDRFTTASGREVALNVWVRPGDESKCDYALDALKRAMRWDEGEYGREYDLDVFNIVAVDDFNMGAMENKGLNIFNSKYVLASPQTATDRDFEMIEAIVAHEYFHNWTGNRITCRDWFQLCLKEGLTVFRDQQFTGDMRSHAVKRIDDVLTLRARQFREDNGPLSHPVRPKSYIEINNFYTATVYEKGAELIGMLRRLVGAEGYAKALDLYFTRHDGQAATIEDWLAVFEDATGRDLSQFKRWYTQSGTPTLSVADDWDDGTYTLTFMQYTPPTPGQTEKLPQHIPIAVGLLAQDGREILPTTVLEMTRSEQSFRFDGLPERPIPSILRGFSAPVILCRKADNAELAFVLGHDTDPFNMWEAGRQLTKRVLTDMILGQDTADAALFDALERSLRDDSLDPAFRALVLRLPSEDDLARSLHAAGVTPDPDAIYAARGRLEARIAMHLSDVLPEIYEAMDLPGPYTPDAKAAGCRTLRQAALRLLSRLDGGARAMRQAQSADNMTEELGALACVLSVTGAEAGEALDAFYRRWQHDRLVLDKWFSLQISEARPDVAVQRAAELTRHPDFDMKNPNRFRAVLGALCGNAAGFHRADGSGYDFVADWLIRLDPLNPQTAARMTTAFETWRRYDGDRQALIRAALERIAASEDASRDTSEMVGRMLAD